MGVLLEASQVETEKDGQSTRIKDKYFCVQFRTTDNESNCNSGEKPFQKMTGEYRNSK